MREATRLRRLGEGMWTEEEYNKEFVDIARTSNNFYIKRMAQNIKQKVRKKTRKKREWFIQQRGDKCEICGDYYKEFHHKEYSGKDDDVVMCCMECHKRLKRDKYHKKENETYIPPPEFFTFS